MKIMKKSKFWLYVFACSCVISTAFAETLKPVTLASESAVWLVGDSTLHGFTSRTSTLTLSADMRGIHDSLWERLLENGQMENFILTIPVVGLKSSDGALDKNLYKALSAETHPAIEFSLKHYGIVPSTSSPNVVHILSSGTLKIAGVERPIYLDVEAFTEKGDLRARGTYALRMTDFGIKPPKLMMGAIKVKNEITIHFDLRLR